MLFNVVPIGAFTSLKKYTKKRDGHVTVFKPKRPKASAKQMRGDQCRLEYSAVLFFGDRAIVPHV